VTAYLWVTIGLNIVQALACLLLLAMGDSKPGLRVANLLIAIPLIVWAGLLLAK
jgi:hypothetical protein